MMQNLMQRGLGSLLNSGGNDQSSIKSALSQLQNQVNDSNHPLVHQVKVNSLFQDNYQAKQYAQLAINMLNEHAEKSAFLFVLKSKSLISLAIAGLFMTVI